MDPSLPHLLSPYTRELSLLIPVDAAGFSVVCTNRPLDASSTSHIAQRAACEPSFAHPTMKSLAPDEPEFLFPLAREEIKTLEGVGKLPHGVWPSGDGTRVYVGLENNDLLTAIDTLTNTVIATVPIGQAAQAVVYVPNAVPDGNGTQGLQPLGVAGQAAHFKMAPTGGKTAGTEAPTSVTPFDQGLIDVLEASVTGLQPMPALVTADELRRPDRAG
jgi:YVTN family beta-propeller protein